MQLPVKPRLSQAPLAFDGGRREMQRLGRFFDGQAGEIAQINDVAQGLVALGQTLQRPIEGQDIDRFPGAAISSSRV